MTAPSLRFGEGAGMVSLGSGKAIWNQQEINNAVLLTLTWEKDSCWVEAIENILRTHEDTLELLGD